jgi:AcrR family transcriptional regulator
MPARKRVSPRIETTLVTTKRGPKAQRGEVSEQILAAARASFAQHGYAGTTMRSVSTAAGVDPALVTYYFRDKPGLLAAVLEPPPAMIAAITAAAGTPRRDRGKALVSTLLDQWESPVSAQLADEAERGLRTGLVASQMIGEVMARYIWRVGALAAMTTEEVVRYVGPTVQRYLFGALPT